MSKEILKNINGEAIYYYQNEYELIVRYKMLKQRYDDNITEMQYDVYLKTNSEPITATNMFNKVLYTYKVKRKVNSTSFGTWDEGEGTIENLTMAENEEKLIFSYVSEVKHYSRVENGGAYFEFVMDAPINIEVREMKVAATQSLPPTQSSLELYYAPDFYDNGTLTIAYGYNANANFTNIQFGISTTGNTADIAAFRDVPFNDCTYTFEFTPGEREQMYLATPGLYRDVYVIGKVIGEDGSTDEFLYLIGQVRLYIQQTKPTLHPVLEDTNTVSLALTGDKNIFVRGLSEALCNFNAFGSKLATITSGVVWLENDEGFVESSATIKNETRQIGDIVLPIPYGTTGTTIKAQITDSRGATAEATVADKTFINYVKLTCNQDISIYLENEIEGKAHLTINGNYYNGSFGAVDNELKLYVRHTQNDGNTGEWVELTDGLIPVFDGDTYTLEVTISGFEYNRGYTFQCKAEDKVRSIITPEYTARITPVFDWGEKDFNFNVPVEMKDGLNVNGTLTNNGDKVYSAHILSDSISDDEILLNDAVDTYKYIEIIYTDNNGYGYGCNKVVIDTNKTIYWVQPSLTSISASGSIYLRSTLYRLQLNRLEPRVEQGQCGYTLIQGSNITHVNDANYIKIIKVIGYK